MTIWLIIAAAGALTFAIRASALFLRPDALAPVARHALRYVTPAVLAGVIVPAVMYVGDQQSFSAGPQNERLLAALLASAVAWLTRNTWLTIGSGMSALWLLQVLGSRISF